MGKRELLREGPPWSPWSARPHPAPPVPASSLLPALLPVPPQEVRARRSLRDLRPQRRPHCWLRCPRHHVLRSLDRWPRLLLSEEDGREGWKVWGRDPGGAAFLVEGR